MENKSVLSVQSTVNIQLNAMHQRFQNAENFDTAFSICEREICQLLNADNIRIYRYDLNSSEIVTRVKVKEELKEVRHGLSPSSIAGYTALTRLPLCIENINNDKIISELNPNLKFNKVYDALIGSSSFSIISLPLLYAKTMLGVFQAVTTNENRILSGKETIIAKNIGKILAQKIYVDLNTTQGPFDYLVKSGKITAEKLKEIEEESKIQNVYISCFLIEMEISIDDIGKSLEKYFQIPFMKHNPNLKPPQSIIKNISKFYLRKNLWVPILGNPDRVSIIISDPNDINKITEIQKLIKAYTYEFYVGLPEDILLYLGEIAPKPKKKIPPTSTPAEQDKSNQIQILTQAVENEKIEDEGNEDKDLSPVITLVNKIITQAHKIGASDIHIEPSKEGTLAVIRMRIDGQCRKVFEFPEEQIRQIVSRIKIISGLDIAERRKPQDGKAKFKLNDKEIELRIATVPTVNGESVVLRMLASSGALPIEKLNLSNRNETEIKKLVARPHGIFLVVGPTGSGKTTTLHAVLGHINTPDRKIWTAEDPVEITQPGLQQVQVIRKIGLDFAAVMRAFLRADPDVILIGEMRDFETANIGIEASLTGHLVFSTLHTNSAPETVIRLFDLGLDPFNFSDALLGILAQRLVKTLCPDCKTYYKPEDIEFERIIKSYGEQYFKELNLNRDNIETKKAKGCEKCSGSGYRGRTGIHELLVASDILKRIIGKKGSVEEILKQSIAEGMRTLLQDGVLKIVKGFTDFKQLHKVAAE